MGAAMQTAGLIRRAYPRAHTMLLDNTPTPVELRVLQGLSHLMMTGQPFFLNHLATVSGCSRSGLNELLNRLRSKGMVWRSRPGEFHILPKGAEFVAIP
jgi:biotin operon repressor